MKMRYQPFTLSACAVILCTFFLLPVPGRFGSVNSLKDRIKDRSGNANDKIELYQELYEKTGEHDNLCLKTLVHRIESEFRKSDQYSSEYAMYMAEFPGDFPRSFFEQDLPDDFHANFYFIEWAIERGDSRTVDYLKDLIILEGMSVENKAIASYALLGNGHGGSEIKDFVEKTVAFNNNPDGDTGNLAATFVVAIATAKLHDRRAINPLKVALNTDPADRWLSVSEDAFSALCEFPLKDVQSYLVKSIEKYPETKLFREARLSYENDKDMMEETFGYMGTGTDDVDVNLKLFTEFIASEGNRKDLTMLVDKLTETKGIERLMVTHAIKRIIKD